MAEPLDETGSVATFLGIPSAQPPLGNLRWKPSSTLKFAFSIYNILKFITLSQGKRISAGMGR